MRFNALFMAIAIAFSTFFAFGMSSPAEAHGHGGYRGGGYHGGWGGGYRGGWGGGYRGGCYGGRGWGTGAIIGGSLALGAALLNNGCYGGYGYGYPCGGYAPPCTGYVPQCNPMPAPCYNSCPTQNYCPAPATTCQQAPVTVHVHLTINENGSQTYTSSGRSAY